MGVMIEHGEAGLTFFEDLGGSLWARAGRYPCNVGERLQLIDFEHTRRPQGHDTALAVYPDVAETEPRQAAGEPTDMNKRAGNGQSWQRAARGASRILIGALLLGVAACGGGTDSTGKSGAGVSHPWIKPPHDIDAKAVTLAPFLVYRVHPERVQEAVDDLKNEPYIQISPSMAARYTKADVRVPAEMRPFLIRGLDTGSSEITVIQSMLGLWVKVVGGDLSHLSFQPLVVLVDPTPTDIYVTVEPKG